MLLTVFGMLSEKIVIKDKATYLHKMRATMLHSLTTASNAKALS